MRKFAVADAVHPPPPKGIVFVGSSSIAFWHTLEEDMAPLTVLNRGFGGSTMHDAAYWVDTLILKYSPRAVVIYEGDNDIASGATPEQVLSGFEKLISRIQTAAPSVRVYFLTIKPSPLRWDMWPDMDRANRLIKDFCQQGMKCHFIDVASAMLSAHNQPRADIFADDKLHMNAAGYGVWTSVIRPVLLEQEVLP